MIAVVSIQTNVSKDPSFYQSHASEAYSFIEKVAPKEVIIQNQNDQEVVFD